jgi:hydrogenase/urease accessory protein HupE
LLWPMTPGQADELRPGYISFDETAPGSWQLVWKAPMRAGFLSDAVPVPPDNCTYMRLQSREIGQGSAILRYNVQCRGDVSGKSIGIKQSQPIRSDILVRVAPLGRVEQALRLTPDKPQATIEARPARTQVAQSYFVIGVEHIVFGFDHLLFVIAMVLLLNGFWTILKAVTAFTIAHSITLVGTTLGYLGLPQQPVESVIALSILFLAVEIVKRRPGAPRLAERLPWLVAFTFGLLHGFGFAGALREIGLPETGVPLALAMFNIGVEAGQVAIVIATGAIVSITDLRFPPHARWLRTGTAYVIGCISAYWFIDRLLG